MRKRFQCNLQKRTNDFQALQALSGKIELPRSKSLKQDDGLAAGAPSWRASSITTCLEDNQALRTATRAGSPKRLGEKSDKVANPDNHSSLWRSSLRAKAAESFVSAPRFWSPFPVSQHVGPAGGPQGLQGDLKWAQRMRKRTARDTVNFAGTSQHVLSRWTELTSSQAGSSFFRASRNRLCFEKEDQPTPQFVALVIGVCVCVCVFRCTKQRRVPL